MNGCRWYMYIFISPSNGSNTHKYMVVLDLTRCHVVPRVRIASITVEMSSIRYLFPRIAGHATKIEAQNWVQVMQKRIYTTTHDHCWILGLPPYLRNGWSIVINTQMQDIRFLPLDQKFILLRLKIAATSSFSHKKNCQNITNMMIWCVLIEQ